MSHSAQSCFYSANLDWDPSRLSPIFHFPPFHLSSLHPISPFIEKKRKEKKKKKKPSCLWLSCPPAYEALFYFDHRSTMDSCHSGNFIQYQPKFTYCLTSLCVTVDASDQSAFGNLSHLIFFLPVLHFECMLQTGISNSGAKKGNLSAAQAQMSSNKEGSCPGDKDNVI